MIQENNQKAVRLVEYLLKLANLRTKPIRDIDNYDKVLWLSFVPKERECFTLAWGRDDESEPDEWLEVKNRPEPKLPDVPKPCTDWVRSLPELRNKDDLPELLPEITQQIPNPNWDEDSDQPETIPHTERLEEHPEVQRAWDRYVEDKWLPWTEEHNAWEKVHKVYSALFAIHQEQLRLGEEYELVLGLGLLTWQTPTGQRVRRHLIVADAILEFEARLGKFTVRPHTEGAKLRPELDMLDIEDQPSRAEEAAKEALAAAEDDPWDKKCVEGVLQALVHSINPQGVYEGSLEAKSTRASEKPIVEYAPALILRKRSSKGLTENLKRIKEQLENGEVVPSEFADLAEIHPKDGCESNDKPEEANTTFDGEIFFPKPANDEQRRIVAKLRISSGVLVQGPPGTGKSHTIANLICHLLATGQRILITAKSTRALQVLKGLMPDELHPLCINLLGNGNEERSSMESSVRGILSKNEEWNEDEATLERWTLEERLRDLREEKEKVNRRLRDIREAETHTHSIAESTYRGTVARIAEAVNRERANYEWFTDTVRPHEMCQISTNDLRSMLEALRLFTPEKRRELGLKWPDAMLSFESFSDMVKNEASAIEEEENSAHGADEKLAEALAKNDSVAIEALHDAFMSFQDTYRRLRALSSSWTWMNDTLNDVLSGNTAYWQELLRVTRNVIVSITDCVATADEAHIDYPDSMDKRTLCEDARKLKEYMENGGKLGWGIFRPKTVRERLYVIKAVKIGGHPCTAVEHFANLADVLHVRIEFEKAWGFWKGRSEKVEGPYALQLIAFKSLCDALENVLALEEQIAKCREALSQCSGMGVPIWADESQSEIIISTCRLALARIRKRLAAREIGKIKVSVSQIAANGNKHPVTEDLLKSIRSRDLDGYARCFEQVQDLEKQRQRLQELDKELSQLSSLLPQFTKTMVQTCNEPHWEEKIQRFVDAWRWAQARYWIEEYIRQEDVPALATRAKQLEDEINSIIAKLAALHAWSFCFSRLNEAHRRHMEAWKQSMQKLGKGTGKHAPRHRREAQSHLNECRAAVPAWVMHLNRVWDTVDPSPGIFDVIIVDEASQCGFEALPLLYLGKKILIVGDDKQISPEGVGESRDHMLRLREDLLYDFSFKFSFDIESSLFDHGKIRYSNRQLTLREHFRCMPEVIRFSNDLCYRETPLIPLRQYGPNRLPPLEHVFVDGGYREGSNNRVINRLEAAAIVERIVQMCGDSRYDGKTMGVVVLQGEAQADLIEDLLLERLGAEEMERRRLVCGNPYSFQGDERDIILLSLVAASNERIGAFTKAADERRFNVAASRAKDQMILFHSVTSEDLSEYDLRRKLLEFFENTKPQQIAGIDREDLERRAAQDNRLVVKPPAPFESWFEVDVALELLRKGYNVLAQHEVARRRIDLVIEGGQARLAVECDGDNWHGVDNYENDMQRQRQLERCGWEFFRVRESAFYADKNAALQTLWPMLEERGIYPIASSVQQQAAIPAQSSSDVGTGEDERANYTDELPGLSAEGSGSNGHCVDDVSDPDIQSTIVKALSVCPNRSCTVGSLATRVLKELGIVTRGNPRKLFEQRVICSLNKLEGQGLVEKYKAKNNRVRLLQP